MGFGYLLRGVSIAAAVSMLIIGIAPASSTSSAQGSDALLVSSYVVVVQGENDVVSGVQSNDDFYALRILSYSLPHDVSRVYTKVPSSADEFNVWTSSGEIPSTEYGREASGLRVGDFFVDVPDSHTRTAQVVNVTDEASEFNFPGSEFTNTTYSSGALRLGSGFDSGEYVSAKSQIPNAYQVTNATLVFNGNSSSNITTSLSNDGGVSWVSCENNTQINFTSSGASMMVRFLMEGNATAGYEPYVASYLVNTTYIANNTAFTVHLSYVWTEEFADGKTALDLTETADFASGGSCVAMVYLVPGYGIDSSDIELTFDEDGALSSYEDKDLYYVMTVISGEPQPFTIVVSAPQKGDNALYYAAAVALMTALGLAYAYSRKSRARKVTAASEQEGVSEVAEPALLERTTYANDEARRKELVARKKQMLEEIEQTRARLQSGAISKKEAETRLAELKREFKSVRNELNRLSRRGEVAPSATSPLSSESSASDYELLLAALARIDDDFKKGLLPEATYKSLRSEYVSKAAKLRSSGEVTQSPLDAEKSKLLEAIVALDEERARGGIDEKVYAELRASYRKQLVELAKESEREA